MSILDLPPTLLWWFGRPAPTEYEGRALVEAFVPAHRAQVEACGVHPLDHALRRSRG